MATTATTRVDQETTFTPTLFIAFELGVHKWKRGFTTGAAQRPRERQVDAGDCQTVLEEIRRAKNRFGFPAEARVISCYKAGRDGFWLHRFLVSQGRENFVVDFAFVRHRRRGKTRRGRVEPGVPCWSRRALSTDKLCYDNPARSTLCGSVPLYGHQRPAHPANLRIARPKSCDMGISGTIARKRGQYFLIRAQMPNNQWFGHGNKRVIGDISSPVRRRQWNL